MAEISESSSKLAQGLASGLASEAKKTQESHEKTMRTGGNVATKQTAKKVKGPLQEFMNKEGNPLSKGLNSIKKNIKKAMDKLKKKLKKVTKKATAKVENKVDEAATKAAQAATRAAGDALGSVTFGAAAGVAEGVNKAQDVALKGRQKARTANAERDTSLTNDVGEKIKSVSAKGLEIVGGDSLGLDKGAGLIK